MNPQQVQEFLMSKSYLRNSLFTFAEIIRVLPSDLTGIYSDLFGFIRDLMWIWRYLNSAFMYLKDFHIR